MAWLEAHDELLNHPKTAVLSVTMGWSKFESVGRLLAFWWCGLKYAPTGDLRKFNDAALASSVELNGNDAQKWKEAMIAACWLDRSKNRFRVHDWPQFTKRFLRDSRFNGRPDKWLEVLEVYPDMPFLVDESLKSNSTSNSRVTRRVTQTTNQPTNLPSKDRLTAAQKAERIVKDALDGSLAIGGNPQGTVPDDDARATRSGGKGTRST